MSSGNIDIDRLMEALRAAGRFRLRDSDAHRRKVATDLAPVVLKLQAAIAAAQAPLLEGHGKRKKQPDADRLRQVRLEAIQDSLTEQDQPNYAPEWWLGLLTTYGL